MAHEFFERCLRHAVDVHRVAAYKQGECLHEFCRALRIRTVEGLDIVHHLNPGGTAAGRTRFRNIAHTASRQILCDLWNDHICFVDKDFITHTEIQRTHDTDVVDACAGNRSSFQLDRLKNRNRIDETGSRRAPLNFKQSGLLLFIRPFEGESVPREFRGCAK